MMEQLKLFKEEEQFICSLSKECPVKSIHCSHKKLHEKKFDCICSSRVCYNVPGKISYKCIRYQLFQERSAINV